MENNQTQIAQTTPSQGRLDNTKANQIAYLVRQSFDLFHQYGKDPAALESITRAFLEDLSDKSQNDITEAFLYWRKHNSVMPTTSDILSIIHEKKWIERAPSAYEPPEGRESDYHTMGEDEKEKLRDLQERATGAIASGEIRVQRPSGAVPWYGKAWKRFTDEDKLNLFKHLQKLKRNKGVKRAEGYCQYLSSFAGAPKNLYKELFPRG